MASPNSGTKHKRGFTETLSNEQRINYIDDWLFSDSAGADVYTDSQQADHLLLPGGAPSILGQDIRDFDTLPRTDLSAINPFGFDIVAESYADAGDDLSRDRGEKKEIILSYEDWEQEEQLAVHLLTQYVRSAYLTNVSAKRREKALDFVFANICADDEIDFNTCCEILQVRDIVIRTRIQFEYFVRWTILADMPFLILPPDEDLLSEVGFRTGFTGISVSRHAWESPGLTIEETIDRLTGTYEPKDLRKAITVLTESGHISMRGEHLYFTGRNPEKAKHIDIQRNVKKTNYRWSQLW